jgi:TPR repeat protein
MRDRSVPRLLVVLLAVLVSGGTPASIAAPSDSGVPTPLEQALERYRKGELDAARQAFERLATLGVPAASYNLAVMHVRKEVPDASMAAAARLMTAAAEAGFVTAMVGLAELHEAGALDGRRDLAAAHRWQLRAAEAGSVQAQVEAATGFYLGRGAPKDYEAAARWYRQAARQGDPGAQYLIASMYEHGLGVPRDLRLALQWYEECARSGDVAARLKQRELASRLAPEGPD